MEWRRHTLEPAPRGRGPKEKRPQIKQLLINKIIFLLMFHKARVSNTAHRATRFLHLFLSSVASRASFHVRLSPFKFFMDGLWKVLPWPSPSPRHPVYVLFSSSMVAHSSRVTQLRTPPPSDDATELLLTSCSLTTVFSMLSLQETCRILLSHLWCAASSLPPFATMMGQVSTPYRSVLNTIDSYS